MTKEVKRYTFFAYLDDEVAELDCREEEVGDYVLASDYAALEQEHKAALLQVEALRELLLEASEEIACWGAYASDYFQEKHDLPGCVAKFHDAALQAKP